eukprot:5621229-Amphidinium_carterae.1
MGHVAGKPHTLPKSARTLDDCANKEKSNLKGSLVHSKQQGNVSYHKTLVLPFANTEQCVQSHTKPCLASGNGTGRAGQVVVPSLIFGGTLLQRLQVMCNDCHSAAKYRTSNGYC